jgi:hypothetical protein
MSTTKIHSTCRIANIGPDDAMILAHATLSARAKCRPFAVAITEP